MNPTIFRVLQALNQIEVHGEKNMDLLLYAIQQLKPLQTQVPEPQVTEETSQEVE